MIEFYSKISWWFVFVVKDNIPMELSLRLLQTMKKVNWLPKKQIIFLESLSITRRGQIWENSGEIKRLQEIGEHQERSRLIGKCPHWLWLMGFCFETKSVSHSMLTCPLCCGDFFYPWSWRKGVLNIMLCVSIAGNLE